MIRIGEPEIKEVARLIRSGKLFRYDATPERPSETELFEREWAAKIGTRNALAVTSGTAALICACAGLGLGPGDEVIMPGYTFMATAAAVLACGAVPVLAEIDETLMLDPKDVERRISPRTKAVIPVHMLGMPCDMDGIMTAARKRRLAVIEDACQMDAGSYKGRRVGSIGDVGCFSFNYFKIVTCGEGGAITTDKDEIYYRALVMHDSGLCFRPFAAQVQVPIFVGLNFRLNNILAAVLRAQTAQVDDWLAAARSVKKRMVKGLAAAGVRVMPANDPEGDCGISVGIQFDSEAETLRCMELLKDKVAFMRPFDTGRHVYSNWDPILEHRVSHNEATNPFAHPANQKAQAGYTREMLPRTLDILKRTVIIELNPFLSEEEVERRVETVAAAYRQAAKPPAVRLSGRGAR